MNRRLVYFAGAILVLTHAYCFFVIADFDHGLHHASDTSEWDKILLLTFGAAISPAMSVICHAGLLISPYVIGRSLMVRIPLLLPVAVGILATIYILMVAISEFLELLAGRAGEFLPHFIFTIWEAPAVAAISGLGILLYLVVVLGMLGLPMRRSRRCR